MTKHYVYLIPGFFGFANLGGISYFHHVRHITERLMRERGVEPEIHAVNTLPTASIRKRAYKLYEQVLETATDPDAPIHLIGHSTGGLDARLFTTPTAQLLRDLDLEPLAGRVRSVVTVASPHQGTPLAFFFNSLLGQNLLYLLSMATIYALRFGKFPLSTLFSLLGVVTKLDDLLGLENTIVDQFYDNLFSDFEGSNMAVINAFLDSIREDRALLGQLTTGGIDLLNAAAEDRPGVAYGCVLTKAARPRMNRFVEIGVDPYRQSSHLIYRLLHLLTSFVSPLELPEDEQITRVRDLFGELPPDDASDGVVPTWSQIHGEVIHCVNADHLDVCGHFNDAHHDPPHVDWLCSGTGFGRADFELLWEEIVAFLPLD
jgi:hypothetical protein